MISSRVQAGLGSALRPGRLAAEMEEDDLGLVGRRPHVPGGAGGSAKVGAVVGAQGMARGAVEIGVIKVWMVCVLVDVHVADLVAAVRP